MQNNEVQSFILSIINPEMNSFDHKESLLNDQNIMKMAFEYAKLNGLSYLFLIKYFEATKEPLPFIKEEWISEIERFDEYKFLLKVISNLDAKYGVEYSIIKACNYIPHIPRDIDIFVDNKKREEALKSLEMEGLKCIHSQVSETSLLYNQLKIDIYTEISYFGFDFIDSEFIQVSSRSQKNFEISYIDLNDDANLLLTVLHSIFGHRTLTLLDFLFLNELLKKTDITRCRDYATKKGWGKSFDLMIRKILDIDEEICINKKNMEFPYLFEKEFLWKCINSIESIQITNKKKIFLNLSMTQDKLIFKSRKSRFYPLLLSFRPVRESLNLITSIIKQERGDIKSKN